MTLLVDLDSHALSVSDSSPVRGEILSGGIQFVRRGVPQRLTSGTAILVGMKSWDNPADVLLASAVPTRPAADGSPYTFNLNLNTAEMLAKFTAGVTFFDTSLEVKWETSPGSGTYFKTNRKKYRVDADTIRDTDAIPPVPAVQLGEFYVSNGSGLTVNIAAGHMPGAAVAAQTGVVITNATNYVELGTDGTASVNTSGFTAGNTPLAVVVASAGAITSNTDVRSWVNVKGSNGGTITSPNVLHVQTDGNDSTGDGSPGKPFASPAVAVSAASDGDCIKIHKGTYAITGTLLTKSVDFDLEEGVLLSRTHAPTRATSTLVVSGYDLTEGTVTIDDGSGSPYSVDFINRDTSPLATPSAGNGVVYFANADGDSTILAALIDALTTGTGVTPNTTTGDSGTVDPHPKCSGTSGMFASRPGTGRSSPMFSMSLTGISTTDSVAGTDDFAGIFDDRSGAVTCRISGSGMLTANFAAYSNIQSSDTAAATSVGIVRLSQNGTVFEMDGMSIIGTNGSYISCSGIYTENSPRHIIRLSSEVSGCYYGYWWKGGRGDVSCPTFSGLLGGVLVAPGNGTSGDLYLDTNEITTLTADNAGYPPLLLAGGSPTAAAWIYTKTIHGLHGTPAIVEVSNSSRCYVFAQKLWGSVLTNSGNTTGLLYVLAQKQTAMDATAMINHQSGTTQLEIWHQDTSGFACSPLSMSGGTVDLRVRRCLGDSATTALSMSSGTLNLHGSSFDISANSSVNCLGVSGGTANLRECVLVAHSSKKDIAQSGGTVTVTGGRGSGTLGAFTTSGTVGYTKAPTALVADTANAWTTPRNLSLTGDATATLSNVDGSAAVSGALTLATVATAGTTGSSTAIPVITINAKGLTTSITTAAVVAPAGTLTGTTLASNVVSSSLTGVGTLTSGSTGAGFTVALSTATITGNLPDARNTVANSTTTSLSGAALSINPSSAGTMNNVAIGGTTPTTGIFTFGTFNNQVAINGTTSLLLGTAGSAVGNIGFRNATSGTATLAPPTGALGTYTVTLPNAASTLPIHSQQMTFTGPTAARTVTLPDANFTAARTDAGQTFTGVQAMTSPDITTSLTTPSTTFSLVNATATTVNFAGAATTLNIGNSSGTATMSGVYAFSDGTWTNGSVSTPPLSRSASPTVGIGFGATSMWFATANTRRIVLDNGGTGSNIRFTSSNGNISFGTQTIFENYCGTTKVFYSTTSFAPEVESSTAGKIGASTTLGGYVGGFGTTNDFSIVNRAGTVALAVTANSTGVAVPGTLSIGGASAAATTSTKLTRLVSGIADNTATAVFTVTVPNAAHSGTVAVVLAGSLGAGGAIGANEATGVVKYFVSITRTAGVNAVANISSSLGATSSSVSGGATIAVTGSLGAVSGAVGASNTFTIQVTIARGSGSSTNHTCTATAELLNANASGITIN